MKPFIIFNPTAGSVAGKTKHVSRQLEQLRPLALRETRKTGDAEKWTREAIRSGCKYIIAAGGDGTLNEIVNGLIRARRRPRIGLLPLGTGNDFARSLGLPHSFEDNIDILRSAQTRPIDIVGVKSDRIRYFVNVSAGGFSGIVDEKLTPKIKRSWGPLAYVRGAAAALPSLHAYKTRIVFDDDEEVSMALYNMVIANGRFVGGGLPIAPDADPSDGLLDIVLIPKLGHAETVLLAAEIVLGKHLSSKAIVHRKARKISVRARPGMCFNVDGEFVGSAPAVFQIGPGALDFVVDR